MNGAPRWWLAALRVAIPAFTFVVTLFIRTRGISTHFWLLGDQIRDWSIALGSFSALPLIGPATHVHGYTIGPAFYWILWAIRVGIGPWFENLPHAGGIGQAMLQSAGDALLLVAIWRRTRSVWTALTTVVLVATASYDLCLSALIWNPTVGSALTKMATALILLDFARGSAARVALTAALAWSAVHAYTGTIFVAVSVFGALLADPLTRRDRRGLLRNALVIAAVVAVLQVPYVAHQVSNRFQDSAIGAVTGSVGRILSGGDDPRLAESVAGYVNAVNFIQVAPLRRPLSPWVLLVCGAIVGLRYRRDPVLLTVTLVPQVAAILGYAFFLGDLDGYYYLSLMPAAVLTIVLAATAVPWPPRARPASLALAIALLGAALALVPARLRFAATMHRMPEYGVLVDASRTMARRGQPLREIRTDFTLPPTSDPEFVYRILGGRIDPQSPWIGIITVDGRVLYRHVAG